jgi:hypothetical protein
LDAQDSFGSSGWFSSGKFLFLRKGTLLAQDFDPARFALRGTPFLVAAPPPGDLHIRAVSASTNGRIAYRLAPAGADRVSSRGSIGLARRRRGFAVSTTESGRNCPLMAASWP